MNHKEFDRRWGYSRGRIASLLDLSTGTLAKSHLSSSSDNYREPPGPERLCLDLIDQQLRAISNYYSLHQEDPPGWLFHPEILRLYHCKFRRPKP